MFKPGMKRPKNAGRKAGTPNRSRILRVAEVLARNKFNPIEEILRRLPELEPRDYVKTCLELQSYVECKPRENEPETAEPEANPAADLTPDEIRKALS